MMLPRYMYVAVGVTSEGKFVTDASECEQSLYNRFNDLFEDGIIVDYLVRKVVNR